MQRPSPPSKLKQLLTLEPCASLDHLEGTSDVLDSSEERLYNLDKGVSSDDWSSSDGSLKEEKERRFLKRSRKIFGGDGVISEDEEDDQEAQTLSTCRLPAKFSSIIADTPTNSISFNTRRFSSIYPHQSICSNKKYQKVSTLRSI